MRSKETKKGKNKKQSEDKVIRAIEDRIMRVIREIFKQEEDYYKSVWVGLFYSNNYIEYESSCDINKILSIK